MSEIREKYGPKRKGREATDDRSANSNGVSFAQTNEDKRSIKDRVLLPLSIVVLVEWKIGEFAYCDIFCQQGETPNQQQAS